MIESMRRVRTLGLLGTGVIGGGWAARALHFGIDVIAADVKPEMEAWIRGAVANAESSLARLTSAPLPPKGKLSFTTDLAAMARQADFIQENIPEQLELKQRVLAEASRHAPAEVVIASSTSGLMPTDLQRDMRYPERFLVAHPFNPVYLLPLVELVGGRATSQGALEAAGAFYTYIGMHPLRVRSEVWPPPGTPQRDLLVPIFNSIVLFSSGATMHGAHLAMKRGDTELARGGIIATMVLGAAFLCGQAFEYITAGYGLSSGVLGSSFFTLTGFHGAHVLVGLIFLGMVYIKAGKGAYTAEHHLGVEASALYWHFVDAVWVFLLTVLYLI